MERWIEMTMRHHRERVELVQSLAQSRYTQAEAAKILDISRTNLNNFIQRNGIYWPVIRQGRKSGEQRVTKDSVIDNQSSIDNFNGQQT